ncbi:hypothetical protein [Halomonas sp. E19]|uniref:hypothetical protein n=1 Tax=Halomonas sp. E19 TaxID=3397247 RepID=UPI004034A0A0
MNEWLMDIGRFAAQLTILTLVLGIVIAVLARARSEAGSDRLRLRIEELNQRYEHRRRRLAWRLPNPACASAC